MNFYFKLSIDLIKEASPAPELKTTAFKKSTLMPFILKLHSGSLTGNEIIQHIMFNIYICSRVQDSKKQEILLTLKYPEATNQIHKAIDKYILIVNLNNQSTLQNKKNAPLAKLINAFFHPNNQDLLQRITNNLHSTAKALDTKALDKLTETMLQNVDGAQTYYTTIS